MVVLYAFFGFHLKHLQFSARDEDIVDKKGLTMNGYRGEGGVHGWDVLFCNTISQNNKKEKEKLKKRNWKTTVPNLDLYTLLSEIFTTL